MNTEALIQEMIAYYTGDPHQIQHFLKVHSFARHIGIGEGLDEHTQATLETAAIVHDIGIKRSMEKYGSSAGNYQELEGPPEARKLLLGLSCPAERTERVCYLVGHHHTYSNIDGIDYQILVEADFLVNFHENEMSPQQIFKVLQTIFRTGTGIALCETIYGLSSN